MMPPMAILISVEKPGRRVRLWLPLFVVWLLLLPLVLVLLPFAILALAIMGRRPFHFIGALFAVLAALKGTAIGIAKPRRAVFIRFV
jgi:hypothetical protein